MTDQSTFHIFADAIASRVEELQTFDLFEVDNDRDVIWQTYLGAFPEGTNPIFRVNTEHDCSLDRHFIRNVGNMVAFKDGERLTIWQISGVPEKYQIVADAMHRYVMQLPIKSTFLRREPKYGKKETFEDMGDHVHTWTHFYGAIDRRCVSLDADEKRGEWAARLQVLTRGLGEISTLACDDILQLIDDDALYRGAEHRDHVQQFLQLLNNDDGTEDYRIANVGHRAARFRNTVIGTLAQDLSNGVELEKAVKSFEQKVAPTNYKRSKSLITPRMVEEAMAKLDELGLNDAIERRMARIEDVPIADVLFVDTDVAPKMQGWAADLMDEAKVQHRAKAGDPGIDIAASEFFDGVLPHSSKASLMLEGSHLPNFMAVTAPVNENVGQLFQWHNNFAWAYDGDVADSDIAQKVKSAGGSISCDLRVSLAWHNSDDLDIHCDAPGYHHIDFASKQGVLDVDMNAGGTDNSVDPVENLAFNNLQDGDYKVAVHQYSKRGSARPGFTLEVDYGEGLAQYTFPKVVGSKEMVPCLVIKVEGGKVVRVTASKALDFGTREVEKWGVVTGSETPIDTIMMSPNHWGDDAEGNAHYFFMLRGCACPDSVRGIYNEFLRNDLTRHRKVFEVLGSKARCAADPKGLAGVGFSTTRHDKVSVKVDGRRYNVQF